MKEGTNNYKKVYRVGAINLLTSSSKIKSLLGKGMLESQHGSNFTDPKTMMEVTRKDDIRTQGKKWVTDILVDEKEIILIGPGRTRISWTGKSLLQPERMMIEYEPRVKEYWLFKKIVEPLILLLNTAAGLTPIHSSGFIHHNKTILITGWTQIGKTEILLRFLKKGAIYISDDWTFIGSRSLLPYPRTIKLSEYNLENQPDLAGIARKIDGESYIDPIEMKRKSQGNQRQDSQDIENERLEINTFSKDVKADYIIFVSNIHGKGIKVFPRETEELSKRLRSVLAFSLIHYLGSIFSSYLYGSTVNIAPDPPFTLSQWVSKTTEGTLEKGFCGCKMIEAQLGDDIRPSKMEKILEQIASDDIPCQKL